MKVEIAGIKHITACAPQNLRFACFYLDSIRLLIFVCCDLEMILTSFFTLNPCLRLQITTRPVLKSAKRAFSAARWAGMRHVAKFACDEGAARRVEESSHGSVPVVG
jgi:hypothetical protein